MPKDSAHYRRARAHAIQRAQERYGIRLTPADYRWLCNRLRNQIGRFVGLQEDGTEIWVASWRRRNLLSAYSRTLNAILTFLPETARVDVLPIRRTA